MADQESTKNLDKRQKSTKIKKNLEGLSERAKKSKLKLSDLIIPISSMLVLVLLSIFLFIPMINTANQYRRELKETNEKIETLDNFEKSLSEIDDTQLVNDLLIAKKIIPKVLQVSDFVYYIDNLAQRKNLVTSEISAGDVSVGGEETRIRDSLGVSGPLSYTGKYEDILEFLNEIQAYSPYLVTLKDISLSNSGEEGGWGVEFNLTGYYIPESPREPDLYTPFTKYTQFSDIIDIFSVRVERLDE
jgi:Tfp pilus assembly protein PilO